MGLGSSKQPPKGNNSPTVPSANPIHNADGSISNNYLANNDHTKPTPTPPAQIRNPNARHHRTPSQPIAMPISPDADRGISIAGKRFLSSLRKPPPPNKSHALLFSCYFIPVCLVSPSNGFVPTGGELIPTVFTWAHGGKQVAVTGTWCSWKEVSPLKRSTSDFTTILELPPGVHQYPFRCSFLLLTSHSLSPPLFFLCWFFCLNHTAHINL